MRNSFKKQRSILKTKDKNNAKSNDNKKGNKDSPKKTNPKPKKQEQIVKKYFPLPPQPKNYIQIDDNFTANKILLVDYFSQKESDIYGQPLTKFKCDVSGVMSYREREIYEKKKNKKLEIYKDNDINSPKIPNSTIHKSNFIQYNPKPFKFSGYFCFPRPLSSPFYCEKSFKNKFIFKGANYDNFYNKFQNDDIKTNNDTKTNDIKNNIINGNYGDRGTYIRNLNKTLSFEGGLGKHMQQMNSKMINDVKDYMDKENNSKSKYIKKKNKGLNDFIHKLEEQQNNIKEYNTLCKENNKEITKKFKANRHLNYLSPLHNRNNVRENINFDIYKELYKISKVGNSDSIFKPENKKLLDELISYNSSNSPYKTYSDFNDTIRLKNGYNSKKRIDTKDINTTTNANYTNNNTLSTFNTNTWTTNNANKPKSSFKTTTKSLKKNISFDINDKYEKTYTSGFYSNTNRENNLNNYYKNFKLQYTGNFDNDSNAQKYIRIPMATKMKSIFTDFPYEDDFIENMHVLDMDNNGKTKNNFTETTIKNTEFIPKKEEVIKTMQNIKRHNSLEKLMLKGFTPKQDMFEKTIIEKKKRPFTIKRRTPQSIYLNEVEMMRKVNKIAYDIEDKKQQNEIKKILKNKQHMRIYERIKIKT